MIDKTKISFVIPVFNSENLIKTLYSQIVDAVRNSDYFAEVILVNDGSSDNSYSEMKELENTDCTSLVTIDLTSNFGQHNATLCGIENSTGEYIITIDDDLVFSPEQGLQLLSSLQSSNYDFVYGIPEQETHSLMRNVGKMFMKWSLQICNKKIAGASFRVIKKNIAKHISHKGDVVFIDDVLTKISKNFAYVKMAARKPELKSRYGNKKIFKTGMNILFFYSGMPLRLISVFGFIASLFCGFLALFYVVKKLFYHAPSGYTSLIVAVLFSASAVLFAIGILGEYIYRIYKNKYQQDPYFIREINKQ